MWCHAVCLGVVCPAFARYVPRVHVTVDQHIKVCMHRHSMVTEKVTMHSCVDKIDTTILYS